MSKLKGRNVIISLDDTAIAAAKDCIIDVNYDVIEIASANSSRAKEFILGRYEWSISVSGLILAEGLADYVLTAGQEYSLRVSEVEGAPPLQGYAVCPQTRVNASVGSLASGTLTFKGTGPLEKIE